MYFLNQKKHISYFKSSCFKLLLEVKYKLSSKHGRSSLFSAHFRTETHTNRCFKHLNNVLNPEGRHTPTCYALLIPKERIKGGHFERLLNSPRRRC